VKGINAIAVYGLCPSCQELTLHEHGYTWGSEANLYKCVKCDAVNELDMIMRVLKSKRTKTAAA
jgi:hypothetical protein